MISGEEIAARLRGLQKEIPQGVNLVAVSKFQPVEAVRAAYDAGQRRFGESRVQELLEKIPQLPADVEWHFIGHLQTNKVKSLVGKVALIQSVDSRRLLELIDCEAAKKDIVADVLLQVHVAREETKFGFSPAELLEFMDSHIYETLKNVRIRGLMAMATNTDDNTVVRGDFAVVAGLFRQLRESSGLKNFDILSMGMSEDWPIAVDEGADLIRVGSYIFGSRN